MYCIAWILPPFCIILLYIPNDVIYQRRYWLKPTTRVPLAPVCIEIYISIKFIQLQFDSTSITILPIAIGTDINIHMRGNCQIFYGLKEEIVELHYVQEVAVPHSPITTKLALLLDITKEGTDLWAIFPAVDKFWMCSTWYYYLSFYYICLYQTWSCPKLYWKALI